MGHITPKPPKGGLKKAGSKVPPGGFRGGFTAMGGLKKLAFLAQKLNIF